MNLRGLIRAAVAGALLATLGMPGGDAANGGDKKPGAGPQRQWGLEAKATALAFSPDGKRLAVAHGDNTVRLHDAATGKETKALTGLRSPAGALAFSADGKRLAAAATACAGDPGTHPSSFELKVWDLVSGKVLHEVFDKELRKPGDSQRSFAFAAFSPDGTLLAYPARDRHVALWDLSKGAQRHSFRIGLTPSAAAFAPDGKTVAVGTYTGAAHGFVRTFDIVTGKDGRNEMALYSGVLRLRYSPDGGNLLVAFRHHLYQLRLKEKGNGRQHVLWRGLTTKTAKGFLNAQGADFSADGRRTALLTVTTKAFGGEDGPFADPRLLVFDNASGKILHTLEVSPAPVALSPDGRLLAAGGKGGAVEVWGLE